ncbi:MAG: Gfo/Idh/MocA family oxidoreductase [Planctomycetia bacterium]|nr:Gfo/Idh/MocA family oxidoreductase [Planctomycetia bacterium]
MKKIIKENRLNRRHFLKTAALTGFSVPVLLSGKIFGFNGGVSPSNKIVMMSIGVGNRGNELLGGFCHNSNFQMIGVCDCYQRHADRAQERVHQFYQNQDCVIVPKYEEVLQREDIDAVVVATPDHWHTKIAIEACRSGKDVYCEKPLTLTLAEGRQIVAAARKYNRVCTGGSQRVMEDYGYMAPIIQSGAIGEVKEVFVGVGNPPKHCYLPEQPIPEGMDWDRWLGQAPYAPYNSERCSGSYGGGWRNYTEYGNGFLADWGAHKFGGSMYVLGIDLMEPVAVLPKGYEGANYLSVVFPNGVRLYHAPDHDITFVGSEGEYRHGQSTLKPLKAVDVRLYSGGAGCIADDFAFCVRNRVRPFQDFEYAAKTAAVCQLMAIGYKVNRALQWNAEKSEFLGDEEAQRMVSRPQRSPYTIPDIFS